MYTFRKILNFDFLRFDWGKPDGRREEKLGRLFRADKNCHENK